MSPIPWSVVAPIATAIVSLIVAVLAHLRATRAQSEQTRIDRDKLIHQAYKDVLSELRTELERLQTSLGDERKRHDSRSREMAERFADLERQLAEEREEVNRLQSRVAHLEEELARAGAARRYPRPAGDDDGASGSV